MFYALPGFQHMDVVALMFSNAVLFAIFNDQECCLPAPIVILNAAKQFQTDILKRTCGFLCRIETLKTKTGVNLFHPKEFEWA